MGTAGVDQPLGVDREHRRFDGPGHADLDLNALDTGVVVVGSGVLAFERVLPGVTDGERRVLPREALGEPDVRELLPVSGLEPSRGLEGWLRLGDGERQLARPGVEAGALHDGGRLARSDVIAIRDREGVCGDHLGGDGGLMGTAGVDQPLGVDREHRRFDGPGHADLDLNALDTGVVVVGRGVPASERVLPGVSDEKRRVLPRESLRESDVREFLSIDRLDSGGHLIRGKRRFDSKRIIDRLTGVGATPSHNNASTSRVNIIFKINLVISVLDQNRATNPWTNFTTRILKWTRQINAE